MMKNNQRKMQVLLSLEKFDAPVSLAQLLGDLGNDYPARTVRRWLAEYDRFGAVVRTGKNAARAIN